MGSAPRSGRSTVVYAPAGRLATGCTGSARIQRKEGLRLPRACPVVLPPVKPPRARQAEPHLSGKEAASSVVTILGRRHRDRKSRSSDVIGLRRAQLRGNDDCRTRGALGVGRFLTLAWGLRPRSGRPPGGCSCAGTFSSLSFESNPGLISVFLDILLTSVLPFPFLPLFTSAHFPLPPLLVASLPFPT